MTLLITLLTILLIDVIIYVVVDLVEDSVRHSYYTILLMTFLFTLLTTLFFHKPSGDVQSQGGQSDTSPSASPDPNPPQQHPPLGLRLLARAGLRRAGDLRSVPAATRHSIHRLPPGGSDHHGLQPHGPIGRLQSDGTPPELKGVGCGGDVAADVQDDRRPAPLAHGMTGVSCFYLKEMPGLRLINMFNLFNPLSGELFRGSSSGSILAAQPAAQLLLTPGTGRDKLSFQTESTGELNLFNGRKNDKASCLQTIRLLSFNAGSPDAKHVGKYLTFVL